MVDILYKEGKDYKYWSKADAFILPLTGVKRDTKYEIKSFLFWKNHSIHTYKLIIKVEYTSYEDFLEWSRSYLFPILDKKGYLLESYDLPGKTIYVLNISEWAMDIEQFLAGKYSKLTEGAKKIIEKFHIYGNMRIPLYIFAVLYPNQAMEPLKDGNKIITPIEYAAKKYDWDLDELKKIGEIGSIYDKREETLYTDVEELCQSGSEIEQE